MSIVDNNIKSLDKTVFFDDFLASGGNINANDDYSGALTEFSYTNPSATDTLFIGQLNIKIVTQSVTLTDYVGIGDELVNGIRLYYTTDSGATKNYIIDAHPILKSSDYYNYSSNVSIVNNNTGVSVFNVSLNFQRNYSNVKLGENEIIAVELNDDFTRLTEQTFSIIGFLYPTSDLL